VPRLEEKLVVSRFKVYFDSQATELRQSLDKVIAASMEIRSSTLLQKMMQAILLLGNTLNQGTNRGAARGFRLESIIKLKSTKARNNKTTLLHYLIRVIEQKVPDVLGVWAELPTLEGAAKVALAQCGEEMAFLQKSLEKVQRELEMAAKEESNQSVAFCATMGAFLEEAEAAARNMSGRYSEALRSGEAISKYFGELSTKMPFEKVMAVLAEFKRHYTQCMDENEEAKAAEERVKRREEDDKKRERAKAAFVAEKRALAKAKATAMLVKGKPAAPPGTKDGQNSQKTETVGSTDAEKQEVEKKLAALEQEKEKAKKEEKEEKEEKEKVEKEKVEQAREEKEKEERATVEKAKVEKAKVEKEREDKEREVKAKVSPVAPTFGFQMIPPPMQAIGEPAFNHLNPPAWNSSTNLNPDTLRVCERVTATTTVNVSARGLGSKTPMKPRTTPDKGPPAAAASASDLISDKERRVRERLAEAREKARLKASRNKEEADRNKEGAGEISKPGENSKPSRQGLGAWTGTMNSNQTFEDGEADTESLLHMGLMGTPNAKRRKGELGIENEHDDDRDLPIPGVDSTNLPFRIIPVRARGSPPPSPTFLGRGSKEGGGDWSGLKRTRSLALGARGTALTRMPSLDMMMHLGQGARKGQVSGTWDSPSKLAAAPR